MGRSVVLVVMLAVTAAPAQAALAPALPAAALPSPPASDAELLGVLATIHAINREAAAPGARAGRIAGCGRWPSRSRGTRSQGSGARSP
ncbi:hypothetical protein [Nannocystis pusilla]|uniref:hypothetical protein n=1 Tax=Nannocystis pusilla TaxID=889268 RepID=UPI003B816CA2